MIKNNMHMKVHFNNKIGTKILFNQVFLLIIFHNNNNKVNS